jgi:ribonuclease BN (tRNA processing enzyme)
MLKIIFLGSGGGRFNLIKQIRSTGGFLIWSDNLKISTDPGPGALSKLNELKIDPTSLDGLIITHNHIDHYLEAPLLIEAISNFALEKKGFLIASSSIVEGYDKEDKIISNYHLSKLEKIFVLKPNQSKTLNIKNKNFFIKAIPTNHEDPTGFGFVMEIENKKIAYTSDTSLLPQTHFVEFANVDLLIANCLKPFNDNYPGHLSASNVIQLLKATKPKACILSHLGLRILTSNPALLASKIERETSTKTFAAADGYIYDFETQTFKKYVPKKRSKDSTNQTTLF